MGWPIGIHLPLFTMFRRVPHTSAGGVLLHYTLVFVGLSLSICVPLIFELLGQTTLGDDIS